MTPEFIAQLAAFTAGAMVGIAAAVCVVTPMFRAGAKTLEKAGQTMDNLRQELAHYQDREESR